MAGIMGTRGWNDTCKATSADPRKRELSITLIGFWNRSAIKEYQPVKVCQNIRSFVILPGQPRESEHRPALKVSLFCDTSRCGCRL
jgi:hypothetical protein